MQQFHGHRVTYLRVSSKDQKLDRQREMLASVLPQKEFSDQASGRANAPRPGLESCMNYLRAGDQLHISSIDRLARSLIDLKVIVEELMGRGVTVTFHKEQLTFSPQSTDPLNDLMLAILGAFAEFERTIIRERQAEGIAIAKNQGRYRGRQRVITDDQIAEIRHRAAQGEKKANIARVMRISRTTVYRYL
ncbi:hypothetical protein BRL53_05265 [Corynebacterium ulcerans]|uniref:recombinase family protein n=1 Tax=Corynebacterium ulcerans TaxID=65058 RepID=UPI000C777609|nr:recombinase family protein [Corynebacterium ulcerans]PLW00144.1 hypothetical protein BRL53_05265 [Corynebacterium ulcerans]